MVCTSRDAVSIADGIEQQQQKRGWMLSCATLHVECSPRTYSMIVLVSGNETMLGGFNQFAERTNKSYLLNH